jgi:hypothetical protein
MVNEQPMSRNVGIAMQVNVTKSINHDKLTIL